LVVWSCYLGFKLGSEKRAYDSIRVLDMGSWDSESVLEIGICTSVRLN
jgi:hypothetical protein